MAKFKFCPKCAGSLSLKNTNDGRRLICDKCGFIFYQNPKPTVGIFILRMDNQVLLAKRGIEPDKGWWDSVGGFIEEGESPQEAAIRETKEEANLEIELLDLLGVTKGTYHDQLILPISFTAKIISGKMKAGGDVAELKWFSLNDLPKNIAFAGNLLALKVLKERLGI